MLLKVLDGSRFALLLSIDCCQLAWVAIVRQLSIFRQTAVEIGPLGMRVCQRELQKRQNRSTIPLAWLLRVR
jgi:hypothetical protein